MKEELRLMARGAILALEEINAVLEINRRKANKSALDLVEDDAEYFYWSGVEVGLKQAIKYNTDFAKKLAEAYTLMGAAVENAIEAEQSRTLTADDPPPSNESVVLDRLAVAHQRIGAGWYPRGSARGYLWTDMNFPVTLIHDGEDR